MADYSAFESIFGSAIPQVYQAKYPDSEFTRTIVVSSEAADNFVVTRSQILISPKVIGQDLNVFEFCQRVAHAAWDFDHIHQQREARLLTEFQERLATDLAEIEKRWGSDGLVTMLRAALNGRAETIQLVVNEEAR
jgi:hypothetical protein